MPETIIFTSVQKTTIKIYYTRGVRSVEILLNLHDNLLILHLNIH